MNPRRTRPSARRDNCTRSVRMIRYVHSCAGDDRGADETGRRRTFVGGGGGAGARGGGASVTATRTGNTINVRQQTTHQPPVSRTAVATASAAEGESRGPSVEGRIDRAVRGKEYKKCKNEPYPVFASGCVCARRRLTCSRRRRRRPFRGATTRRRGALLSIEATASQRRRFRRRPPRTNESIRRQFPDR